MKIHGYCTRCHKIRRVNVGTNTLALIAAGRRVAEGICDECQSRGGK